MRYGLRLLLIALVQTVLLASMVGAKQWTLATGTAVLLETAPVDPRSLFSGDYVRLGYAIGRLEPDALLGEDEFAPGDPIYVSLARAGETWHAIALHHARPDADADKIAIRGDVVGTSPDRLFVRYGIETFYVPEGEGRELEKLVRDSRIDVEVVVGGDGDAVISALLVDGTVAYRDRLF